VETVVTVEADLPEEVQAVTARSTSATQLVRPSLMVRIQTVLFAISQLDTGERLFINPTRLSTRRG
jgi:hypothetical protein